MGLRNVILGVARLVAEEAEKNPAFEKKLVTLLAKTQISGTETPLPVETPSANRPKNRRPKAILDPVELARENENGLREQLRSLSLDQLKDIVAEYGMDPGKLVMKWKASDRVVQRIVEISLARAQKGDAFRSD